MKNSRILAALLLLVPPLIGIGGCGGGGGGGSTSPTSAPQPTATATVGPRVLVVQLRDSNGGVVEGIVTVGTTVVATSGGNATFNRDLAAGTASVSAEVDGEISSGTANVNSAGTTIFTLTIAPRIAPVPTSTLPPPPF